MPEKREHMPAELVRSLMLEAGYRCSIPTCRAVQPLEIDQLDDYADVRAHDFANLVALCRNCHGMKGSGPRNLDRKALRQVKANLGLMNQRYNDTERRILEYFVQHPDEDKVVLPATDILFQYLIRDGLLAEEQEPTGFWGTTADGTRFYLTRGYELTEVGRHLVGNLRDRESVDS